jgi:hypothetical protein
VNHSLKMAGSTQFTTLGLCRVGGEEEDFEQKVFAALDEKGILAGFRAELRLAVAAVADGERAPFKALFLHNGAQQRLDAFQNSGARARVLDCSIRGSTWL